MEEETLTRRIKIHCPQHHSTFEIEESPKIVCEIREHALSNDFPHSEFWEYCCDCQTFSPSDLEVGGKAKDVCPQCERTMLRRFACDECKIAAYDSGEDTKGKIFHLNPETFAVAPTCPGCLKDFSKVKSHLHKCEETQTVLSTPRKICPFCKKETVKAKPKPEIKATPVIKCLKCQANNEADSFFCNNCGEELRSNPNLSKRGTATAKTQLLGSICPTCGISNRPSAVFCGKCGQALKAVKPRPKQTFAPPIPQSSVPKVLQPGVIAAKPTTTVKPKSSASGLTAAGIILILIIACCVCFNVQSGKNSSNSLSSTTNSKYSSSSPPSYTGTPYSGTPYSNKANNSYSANANKPMNSNVSNMTSNSSSSLTRSFNRTYKGTINYGNEIEMRLERSGSSLSGTVSPKYRYADITVSGTIDDNGEFELDEYDDQGNQTGIYRGRIRTDGTISGTWSKPDGSKSRPLSLRQN